MARDRVVEGDLRGEDARRILQANTTICMTAECLFMYEPLNFRRRTRWDGIMPHRTVLLELFRASGGYLLHQSSLERQVGQFLATVKMAYTDKEAAVIAYRLRVMMSHLRDSKMAGRKPPERYDQLRAILDAIRED